MLSFVDFSSIWILGLLAVLQGLLYQYVLLHMGVVDYLARIAVFLLLGLVRFFGFAICI
jgi:hypothetical protein